MKKEDLFEAIGNIDEYYVKESEQKAASAIRPFGIGRTLVSAAAIVLIFGVAIILSQLIRPDGVSPVDTGDLTDTTDTTLDIAIEYNHPSDEEIKAAYEAACEAASWFTQSSLGTECGDKDDNIVIDGQPYWRVTKFETNDEFKEYLLSLFSDRLAAEFVNNSSDYVVQDGKLYSAPAPGGVAPPWNEEFRISDISHDDEDTISILVTYDIYDYADTSAIAPTGQVIGNEMQLFLYEKVGDKWVFTRFPTLDSMEIYEKYTGTVENDLTDGNYILITNGVNVPIPGEYMSNSYLNIVTGSNSGALITFYCSPTYVGSARGEILRLYRYTKDEYVTNVLQNPVGNVYSLACDGEYYYAMSIPTDLQVDPTDTEGAKKYEQLAEACRTAILESFAAVNGFASVHLNYGGGINILTVGGVKYPIPTDVSGYENLGFDTDGDSVFTLTVNGYSKVYSIYRYAADEYIEKLANGEIDKDRTLPLASDGENYYVVYYSSDTVAVFSEVLFDYFPTINGFDPMVKTEPADSAKDLNFVGIDGVKIPIPSKYSTGDYTGFDSEGDSIMIIYYTPEHDKSGYGEILRIHRYSAGEYERNFLESNLYMGGAFALATDGKSYYVMSTPTDVQADPTNTESFEEYAEVAEACRAAILENFTDVNGFEAVDSKEFYERKYTFDGEHYFIRFYPYGKGTDSYYTLVLSQPAKEGEGGIWCVERWLDHHIEEISSLGHIHLSFPDSGDLSAAQYYAKVQTEFDSGKHSELASPMTAAKAWAAEIFSSSYMGYFEAANEQDMPEGEWVY